MHFQRQFRQDQIRQSQDRAMIVPFLEFLFKHEYPVSDEFVHKTLQIPREFLIEGKIKREVEDMMPKPMPLSNQSMKGTGAQANSKAKAKQAEPQQRNNPSTGS